MRGVFFRNASLLLLTGVLATDVALRVGVRIPDAGAQGQPDEARERRRDSTVRATEKVGPAVANIATERVVVERLQPLFEEFFREFMGRGSERRSIARSLGSGVIIDPAGYIITNAHVVQRASKILVTLPDEREFEAQLLSLSYAHDLALLKIEAGKPLPFVRLGTSSDLMMGETVLALGNPFGLENTVTRGVISARDRRIRKDGRELEGTFLQTDAAINPGNSGGPLVNLDGDLVGVNTAVHAGGQGIGFAIPIDRVREVLCELSDPELLRDLWFGWRLQDAREGIRVARTDEGSPAAKLGIVPGDIVESVGKARVSSVFEVHKLFLGSGLAGLEVTVRGADGNRRSVTLVPTVSPTRAVLEKRLGITARDLTPALAVKKGLDLEQGVFIAGTIPNGPAARLGIEANDVLIKVGRRVVDQRLGQPALEVTAVPGTAALARVLERVKKGEAVAIFVVRQGRELQGELRVD